MVSHNQNYHVAHQFNHLELTDGSGGIDDAISVI